MGLEPMTSSLPRKCSTTELQQPMDWVAPKLPIVAIQTRTWGDAPATSKRTRQLST